MITRRDMVMVALAAFLFGSTAGVLGGMVGARILMNVGIEMSRSMRPPGAPFWNLMHHGPAEGPQGPPPVLDRLERVLDLTPAQRESIGVILVRSRGRFDALRDSLDSQIEAQLTPTQRAQWRTMHPPGPPRGDSGWPHHP
jgi:hypothetical protein